MSVATIGSPVAIASKRVIGRPSEREGKTKKSDSDAYRIVANALASIVRNKPEFITSDTFFFLKAGGLDPWACVAAGNSLVSIAQNGPEFSGAFTETETIMQGLELSGLALGTQSYVKTIVLEGLLNGQWSNELLTELKTRIIPALRIIEALTKGYPTLGMELQLGIDETPDRLERAVREIAIVDFLAKVRTSHRVGPSGFVDTDAYQLRLLPTTYPIFVLLVRRLHRMGVLKDGYAYMTTISGDYLQEAPFLLAALYYSYIPADFGLLPRVPEYKPSEADRDGLRPGVGGRFIGATIDPWTGVIFDDSDPRARGTQTNFFYSRIALSLALSDERGKRLETRRKELFQGDLRRNFLLVTAAAGYLGAYGIQDEALKKLYLQYKSELMKFFIDNVGISSGDIPNLFPELGAGHQYTSIDSALGQILGILRKLSDYFDVCLQTYPEFQAIVNRMANETEEYLFGRTGALPRDVVEAAGREDWGNILARVISGAYAGGAEWSFNKELLRISGYPEADKILSIVNRLKGQQEPSPDSARSLNGLPMTEAEMYWPV